MISIFNGRERTLGGEKSKIFAQIGVEFRQHLHHFKGARLHVFLAIGLHANKNGWAWPSVSLLSKETGYNAGTINTALKDLCALTINEERVLLKWQPQKKDSGQFHSNHYLLFPSASEVAEYRDKGMQNTKNNLPSVENTGTVKATDKVYPVLEEEPTEHVASATPADATPEHIAGYVLGLPIVKTKDCAQCGYSEIVTQMRYGLCENCYGEMRDEAAHENEAIDYDALVKACGKCGKCGKLGATTREMADIHNVCTCQSEKEVAEFLGEKPERAPQKTVEHWTVQAGKPWAQWGAESDEFQRQLQRFGDSGRVVQELGYKLEQATGLKPLWGTPKKVKWWSSGLWELYQEAGDSVSVAIEAVRALKANKKLTAASPYSFVNTARALAASNSANTSPLVFNV